MKNNEYNTVINWHYIAVALIFAAVILIAVLYFPKSIEFDSAILQIVRDSLFPLPEYIPGVINEICRNNYAWPLIVSGSVLVSHKYYLKAFLLVFFTQASNVVATLIKDVVCRQRPCGNAYPGYSFPSNHAIMAMCFYGILIYLVHKHTHGFWKYLLITLFGLLIVITSLSRLCLGVHFPMDVFEGLLLGFILVNLYIILDKFFSAR